MTAKEYLRRVRTQGKRIDSLIAQRQYVQDMAEGVSGVCYDAVKVQTSRAIHRQESAIFRLIDIEDGIAKEVDTYLDMREEAERYISRLRNYTEQDVLRNYYLTGLTWEEVAELMQYDNRTVYKIHGRALMHLEQVGNF